MRVLVVGSNGSEHALAWKLKESPNVSEVFVTPGNAGWPSLGITEAEKIVEWAKKNADFVVVRADNYIAEGLTDKLRAAGLLVFGPTQAAAKIEWSKAYAKDFMRAEGIPTAEYETFTSCEDALQRSTTMAHPVVIKADGLALGKGVVISGSIKKTQETLRAFMQNGALGASGRTVVIEKFLVGREISVHALCDGERAVLFPPSQDHKRAYDNDEGPNTGGMGTIAPVPWVTEEDMQRIKDEIVLPTLRGLAQRGAPFCGILFPGVMMTTTGPKVIEFNARFGDPETQTYMRLLGSDLLPALVASAKGDVSNIVLKWSAGSAATVMLASAGYPGEHEKGKLISIPDLSPEVVVFHSGTKVEGGALVTNGGRVLGVSATGVDLRHALKTAYDAVSIISFAGMHYRKDIGRKSLL